MPSPLSAIALLAMPLAGFSGGTSPSHLPRGRPVPISLSAGFTSEDSAGGPAPSLNQVRIDLSRRVELRTAGLFACRERLLFKTARAAAEECRGSLVGKGTILTDIPVPTGGFAEPPGLRRTRSGSKEFCAPTTASPRASRRSWRGWKRANRCRSST